VLKLEPSLATGLLIPPKNNMWFYENFIIKEPSVLVFKQKIKNQRTVGFLSFRNIKKNRDFSGKNWVVKKGGFLKFAIFFGESWLYNKINYLKIQFENNCD
jgi:hypothetical protein